MGLWKLLKPFFERFNPNLIYLTLRIVCLLYVLPIGYFSIQITVRDGYLQTDDILQMNFNISGVMNEVFLVAGIIWLALTIRGIIECVLREIKWYRRCRMSVPVDDKAVLKEFRRIKDKLKIRRNIGLYYNPWIKSPMITGIIRPNILIPVEKYSVEQLTVIFYHEFSHYKNCDLLFKFCSVYVGAVQHLNVCANKLLYLLLEWGECYCDVTAVEAMQGEMTAKRYFEIIVDIMRNAPKVENGDYIFSMLYENQLSLGRRIDYMRKYNKISKFAKKAAFVMSFGFVIMSVSTAYAAGTGLAEMHGEIYQDVEEIDVVATAENEETGLQEMYIPAAQDSYGELVYANPELEYIMPMLDANETVSFNWSVTPDTRHVSSKIYVKSGQNIVVSASATPGGKTFWIGIMDSRGDVRCVEGTNSLSYTFSITKSDNYRVLVQNRSDTTISAAGSYYYY